MEKDVKISFSKILALVLLLGMAACTGKDEGTLITEFPTLSQLENDQEEAPRLTVTFSSTSLEATVVTKSSVQVTSPSPTSTPWPTLSGNGGGVIAFQSDRDRQDEIYVMNADGSDQRLLLSNIGALDSMPAWSPDGKQIAIASRDRGKDFEICILSIDHSLATISLEAVRCLTDNDFDDLNPTWSPDGTQIAFSSSRVGCSEIFVVDVDSGVERQLTENDFSDKNPAWSPDGHQIAFVSNRDGDFEIFFMNPDGGDLKRFTDNDSNEWSPAWSPDSKRIVFVSDRNGEQHLYVIDTDGSSIRRLTTSLYPWNDDPAWSPDNKQIAFRSNRNGFVDVYTLVIDGISVPQQLTENTEYDQDRAPTWRPITSDL